MIARTSRVSSGISGHALGARPSHSLKAPSGLPSTFIAPRLSEHKRPTFQWFPTNPVDTEFDKAQLMLTLGRSGFAQLKHGTFTPSQQREVFKHLARRELALGCTWETTQTEVILGFEDWLGPQQRTLQELRGYEGRLNDTLVWWGLGHLPRRELRLQRSLRVTCDLFEALMTDDQGVKLKNLAGLQKMTERYVDVGIVEGGDFYNVLRRVISLNRDQEIRLHECLGKGAPPGPNSYAHSSYRRLHDQSAVLKKYIPEVLEEHMVRTLCRLLHPKNNGNLMTHAPGRFAVIPVKRFEREDYPKPTYSFVVAYMPVDTGLTHQLQGHQKFAHSERAKKERHGKAASETDAPLFYEVAGMFPGALAYARVSVYAKVEAFDRPMVSIDGIFSDVTQHAREYADTRLCEDMMKPLIRFARFFDPDVIYFPAMSAAFENAKIRDLRPDGGGRLDNHPLMKRFKRLYGGAPPGSDREQELFGGQVYWAIPRERFDDEDGGSLVLVGDS